MVVKEFLEGVEDEDKRNFFLNVLKWTKRGAAAAVLGWGILSSWYTVPADSQAVVQRFGKYSCTEGSGLHFKIPYGIDKVTKVPVRAVQTEEFGFRGDGKGNFYGPDAIRSGGLSDSKLEDLIKWSGKEVKENVQGKIREQAAEIVRSEYLMLTGDLNMADVEWIVQYDIKDAKEYLFNIKNPGSTIRDCSLSVMKQLTGNRSVDEVITIGRAEYASLAKKELQTLLDECQSGVNIIAVQIQSSQAPQAVRDSFNKVSQAMQQKEQRINEAMQEYNKEVPRASGEAQKEVEQSKGYAAEVTNRAKGDVLKFYRRYAEYANNPEVTRARMYFDAMEKGLLPKISEIKVIEQKGAEGGILPIYSTGQGGNK